MAIKSLVYIIISVFCIVVAVNLFMLFWNVFIGDDAVNNDVDLLVGRIEAIVAEEGNYSQKPFILQAQDRVVLGFDALEDKIEVDGTEYKKPEACGDGPCICATEEGKPVNPDTCEKLRNARIYLATDYTGHSVELSKKPVGGVSVFSDINVPGTTHTSFALSTDLASQDYQVETVSVRTGTRRTTTYTSEAKAIVAYVIEKYQVPGKDAYIVTLIPQTGRQHERAFHLLACQKENGDYESEPACVGKTGSTSLTDGRYCQNNILTNTCRYIPLPVCPQNQYVTGLCNCGGTVKATGMCGGV